MYAGCSPLKSTPSTDEEVTKQGWRANFKAQHKFDKALAKQTSKETGGRVIVQWKKGAPETLELSTVARKEAQEYWENNADARKFHCAEIRYVGAVPVLQVHQHPYYVMSDCPRELTVLLVLDHSATHNKVQKRIETIVRYHDDDGSRFSGFVVRLNKYDN